MARITTAVGRRGHGSTTELVSDENQIWSANKPQSFSSHAVPISPCGDKVCELSAVQPILSDEKRSSLIRGASYARGRQANPADPPSRDLESPKGGNTYWYVNLGVTSQGVLSQSSATWTSTISCSSSELAELFEPLPQKETHLRAGGLGEVRGETLLRMRQPFMIA